MGSRSLMGGRPVKVPDEPAGPPEQPCATRVVVGATAGLGWPMKLVSFRVRDFRNVIDSEEVAVEPGGTCLVGQNESGKSTVLEAVRRINPTDPAVVFDQQRDYPRWLLSTAKRSGTVGNSRPITCRYALDDVELAAVDEQLGPDVVTADTRIFHEKGYDNVAHPRVEGVDGMRAVQNAMDRVELDDSGRALLGAVGDLDELPAACDAALETTHDAVTIRLLEKLKAAAGTTSASDVVWAIAGPREPRFFYFSDYSMLDGRIDLAELADGGEPGAPGSSARQTAKALLELAGTTVAELTGEDYEASTAELESVSNSLTEQVFSYWKQNDQLRVRIGVDRAIVRSERSINTGYGAAQVVEDRIAKHFLEIRVEDTRHYFTNNFSERSSGFRWFFSFLAAFSQFEETAADSPVVVLLDEPALTLHARAQADFLTFINDRLAPVVQVIYTTHSPFMVETGHLDRVRIVEDKGPKIGAVVSSESLLVSADSRFPLQAALGYDLSQHLFIGPYNLLVEGPGDLLYLDVISRALVRANRVGLDPRCHILPAGSASNIPAFVSLLGRGLTVTVLIDSGTEGSQRIRAALAATGHLDRHLILVGQVTGAKNADIEDLFDVEDYLSLYNATFDRSVTADDLSPGDRIVVRLGNLHGPFDHYAPAEHLLRHPELVDGLHEQTLTNFEELLVRLNAALEP